MARAAEERMLALLGRSQREDLAVRVADGVERILEPLRRSLERAPRLVHRVETLALPRRALTQDDVREALAQAATLRQRYDRALAAVEANPELARGPRWYVEATGACHQARWCEGVARRFEEQTTHATWPAEVHVLRLGDLALATNPFEYFLDYGMQIKARSAAVQTLLVQLAGSGSYLPTQRAVAGRSYGAVPASTPVGPEGGRALAERTIELIAELF